MTRERSSRTPTCDRVSIFGTNDAKAVNWDVVKDDWVDEYKKFIEALRRGVLPLSSAFPCPT